MFESIVKFGKPTNYEYVYVIKTNSKIDNLDNFQVLRKITNLSRNIVKILLRRQNPQKTV
jgi:hypothetical protein